MERISDNMNLGQIGKSGNNGESKPLIEEAARRIKHMIFQQKLVPGQKLVYNDLCRILNMSRTPIINALNRLEQEGFVASENFRGFYVKPIDIQEIWEAFGVREALEVYSVEQAIKSGNHGDIGALEEKRLAHQEYTPSFYTQKKFYLDMEFHTQIATMANNRVLKHLLKRNFEHIYLRSRLNNYPHGRMEISAKDHLRLVERIRKKDILGAGEVVRSHIQGARDNVIRCLSEEGEDEVNIQNI
jgi:DNA-binding GntR family transcriptional regulator